MRLRTLALLFATLLLCTGCGNGYLLYNTRYIPESGTAFGPAAAELPWKPPYIEGQPYPQSPGRGDRALTRYQNPIMYGKDHDILDSNFAGDDSSGGRQDRQRAEGKDQATPDATVHSLRK